MYNIQDMIDVDTIIGEAIETQSGTTIIPISKVCFGFAAGGSDFKEEVIDEYEREDKNEKIKAKNPFGGGAGAGVKISPIGFLIVENNKTSFPRFIPVEHISTTDKILDYIPELFQKIEKMFCNKEKTSDIEDNSNDNPKKDTKENREEEIRKEYYKKEIPTQSDGEDLM